MSRECGVPGRAGWGCPGGGGEGHDMMGCCFRSVPAATRRADPRRLGPGLEAQQVESRQLL